MSKALINIGTYPNDRSGDPIRTAFSKINGNFTELYNSEIPTQTGNGGLYLSTDGVALHWSTVNPGTTLPSDAAGFLQNNGSGVLNWVTQSLGNYVFTGDTISNSINDDITLHTNTHNWTFGSDGNITLPGAGYGIVFDTTTAAAINVGMGALILTSPDINLEATDGTTSASWQFQTTGGVMFPDSSIQTTAWTGSVAYTSVTGTPILAAVATSGSYADLLNTPILAAVATSGSYADLLNTPILATVATSGSYADLLNTPILATVATSGSYADLLNTPILATVATSGSYADLLNTPTIPSLGNLTIVDQTIAGNNINGDIELTPNGNGYVSTPNLKLPVGSLVQQSASIEVIVADLILDIVVDYSTGDGDNLNIGDYGLPNGISGSGTGWCVYQMTTNPSPPLQQEDIISGVNVPVFSNVLFIGVGVYSNIVITDKTIPDPLVIPQPGETIYTVRPIVNASLSISTLASTDISLVVGVAGRVITHATIAPILSDIYDLGTPTKRFKRLWMGAGSIYVQDETLGIDLRLTAIDGNFVVSGGAGLSVGQFTFHDNQLYIADSTRDFIIGTTDATADVVFNRPIRVQTSAGVETFNVKRDGRVEITVSNIPALDNGALLINGSSTGTVTPVNSAGGMIHIIGNDDRPSIITNDAFGTGVFPLYVARQARGTSDVPTATRNNDVLSGYNASGYTGTVYGPNSTSLSSIQFQATEDFTNTSVGTRVNFLVVPTGEVNRIRAASIDSLGLKFTQAGTGVTFSDDTIQTTAWTGSSTQGTFGNIQISGDTILNTVVGNELYISTSDNGGGVTLTADHFYVRTTTNSMPLFSVNPSGTVDIHAPAWNSTTAIVGIDASPGSNQLNTNISGVVLQTTGLDGTPSRVLNDGSSTYAEWVGRRYNGTTETPVGVNLGDIIASLAAIPYLNDNSFSITSTARIELVSTEAQTPTHQGSNIGFWTTPIGSNTINKYLTISNLGVTFEDGTSQNTAAIPMTYLGTAGGVATLGLDGKVTTTQLPAGTSIYKGSWDASTNDPILVNGTGDAGWEYSVSVAGAVDFGSGILTFYAGDYVIYNGTVWQRIPGTNSVSSFNGGIGAVILSSSDVTTALTYTPYNGTLNPNGYVNAAGASAAAPVQSVFGRQGSVTLTTSDVTTVLTAGSVTNTMLVNSSLTVNGTSLSLGGSGTITAAASTLTGTTLNSTVVNSSLTSVGLLSGLSVTATITGSVSGNSGTATVLQNSRNINGVAFNGSADIITHTAGTGISISGTQINNTGVLSINGSTGILTGIITTGDTGTVTNTMLAGGIANSKLANSSITIIAGAGLSGGGTVSLGGSVTLTATGAGVMSLTGGPNIILSASTGAITINRIDGLQTVVTGNNASIYSLLATDQYFGTIHSNTGATTVTLPLGSSVAVGRQYVIKDEGGHAGNGSRRITVTASGSDTIDGGTTRAITSNYGALTTMWTGTRWSVI